MPRKDSIMGAASRRSWWGVRRLWLAVAVGAGMALVASGVAVASPGNGASEFAPGHGGTPPGHGGTPPGHAMIGQFDKVPAPPLDGAELAVDQAKQATAQAAVARAALTRAAPASMILGVPLYQQPNGYTCGPTTLAMMTTYLGIGYGGTVANQVSLAGWDLGTTTDGTAWYGADHVPSYPNSSWYPMQDALNWRLYAIKGGWAWYSTFALTYTPNDNYASTYMNDLLFDITRGWPIAANEYAIPGYQIGGQPYSSSTIMHWVAVVGYADSGWTTYFNDPAPWPVATQRHAPSWISGGNHAGSVVEAVGGRGWVW